MAEHGFYLAKGDRRGFVALDYHGKVYSVARWAGIKTKALKERIGEPDGLSSVDEVRAETRKHLSQNVRSYMAEMKAAQKQRAEPFAAERRAMVAAHRIERKRLENAQDRRSRRLMLAPAGRALLAAAYPLWQSAHRALEATLVASTPERLRQELAQLARRAR